MQTLSLRSERLFGQVSALSPKTLIYLFFFTSGMPALAYQLIWQRVLFRIFGVNIESVTIVVTAFMLGLGIGSLIGSALAARRAIAPLLLIAAVESAIGLFGLGSLRLFDIADHFVQALPLAAKAATAIGLVFVPTALMGMTLPLLVGYLIRRSANVGVSTGALYRVNTLGAVMGCVLCALVLFPFLGLQHAVWIAAGINGAIAAAALTAHAVLGPAGDAADVASVPSHAMPVGRLSRPASLALAFLGGFVSLSYEIFLVRLASFASGTSALTLALFLAAFLMGIASGAQLAAEWSADTTRDAAPRVLRILLIGGLLGLLLLPALSLAAPLGNGLLGIILLAAVAVACCLGVIFPLVAHFAVQPGEDAGRQVGFLYLANILGSAMGSLLTGFVLSDLLDARGLAILLSLLTFGIAALFAWTSARRVGTRLLAAAAAALLIAFQQPLSERAMASMLYKAQAKDHPPLASVVENRDGIIAVSPDGTVYGGGVYDGRFNVSLVHDTNGILRAYALSLYHPKPRDVLMIGLASGSWGQVIANNPDVKRFTIVEINPGYIQLIRRTPQVASLLTNPKVRIVIDDGRRWLKQHPELKFDAIVANTTYHFRANASNVLSMEFDALIRAHLNTRGVYFYNTTDSSRVQRTGCESFRYGYRVFNHLLVSDAPIALDPGRWRQSLLQYRIDGHPVLDLRRARDAAVFRHVLGMTAGADGPAADASKRPMESCTNIRARTTGEQVVTDDNMGTEWRVPLGLE